MVLQNFLLKSLRVTSLLALSVFSLTNPSQAMDEDSSSDTSSEEVSKKRRKHQKKVSQHSAKRQRTSSGSRKDINPNTQAAAPLHVISSPIPVLNHENNYSSSSTTPTNLIQHARPPVPYVPQGGEEVDEEEILPPVSQIWLPLPIPALVPVPVSSRETIVTSTLYLNQSFMGLGSFSIPTSVTKGSGKAVLIDNKPSSSTLKPPSMNRVPMSIYNKAPTVAARLATIIEQLDPQTSHHPLYKRLYKKEQQEVVKLLKDLNQRGIISATDGAGFLGCSPTTLLKWWKTWGD